MKEKDPKYNLMLTFALIIVLAFDIFFVSQKEGYHMDEILSYELSNSEFTPWITPTQPEGRLEKYYRAEIYDDRFTVLASNLFTQISDILKRRGASVAANYTADVYDSPVWMTSSDMKEYVTFFGDDSVIALSAYYNSITDNHPPLYFMLLNIFSAVYAIFFYGSISPWPGCILNMIFMMGSMLIISAFFKNVFDRKYLGPVAALFYGLSPAGMNTVLLIRMYGAVAFFCLAFAYIVLKKLADGSDLKKGNKKLILVTVLGFLTQYFSCILFFFLILSSVIYLISAKKIRNALYLLRTMILSAVWGVVLYPFVFHDLFGTQIGSSVRENLVSVSGYGSKLKTFLDIVAQQTGWSVTGCIMMFVFILIGALIAIFSRGIRFYGPILFVTALGYVLTVSKLAPYTVDRYLMPVFPFVVMIEILGLGTVISSVAEKYLKDIRFRRIVYTGVLFIWTVSCICLVPVISPNYLYTGYSNQERISRSYSSYDAVVVYRGTSFYRNVPELMNYNSCLLLKEEEVDHYDERLASLNSVVIIRGDGVDNEVIRKIGNMYGYNSLTFLMEDGVFGDDVCLLSK
ncbi:MAG: hypothetical protein K6F65_01545 [Lachnospiraceae bacterium]|nr:hypothetical protein [Lachnospiraceae bacterium]